VIEQTGLLNKVKKNSNMIFDRLEILKKDCPIINEVRGLGYLVGIEVRTEVLPLIQGCVEKGVLVNRAGENVLRILPALNITEEELTQGLDVIEEVLKNA